MLPLSPFPGTPSFSARLNRAIRVDFAGEKGAQTIYEGQLQALGPYHPFVPIITEMKNQEEKHIHQFQELMIQHAVRPSWFMPLWTHMGFYLGYITSLIGGKSAMACTAAVEEVIDQHYADQVNAFQKEAPDFSMFLEKCRFEEQEHHQHGIAHGANTFPCSHILQAAIRGGTRCAVWIAERF